MNDDDAIITQEEAKDDTKKKPSSSQRQPQLTDSPDTSSFSSNNNNTRIPQDMIPVDIWTRHVLKHLRGNDGLAFALTCKRFLHATRLAGEAFKLETNVVGHYFCSVYTEEPMRPKQSILEDDKRSEGWLRWTYTMLARDEWELRYIKACYDWYLLKEKLMGLCAYYGYSNALRWLRHERGCPWEEDPTEGNNIFLYAAWGGQRGVIEWLEEDGGVNPKGIEGKRLEAACYGGHVQVASWLMCKDLLIAGRSNMNEAALGGHVHAVRWLRTCGCPWETAGYLGPDYFAAKGGHFSLLLWLKREGCPIHLENICRRAAEIGHMEMLKWARKQGAPLDETMYFSAAKGGQLEILRWLRTEGCAFDKLSGVSEECEEDGKLFDHIYQWALGNRTMCGRD